ncbi:hypothetical protein A946_01580 [Methylacidiphilum kamchatkense Kam1]|uniref:Uncharacterized protein n=2 Tax=Methylacidiphilum kamchatkense Kam1 TaxID=1202785 RepID=A0ABR4ZZ24_9BACT|nr:hypothetical protein A946_01580 [Methylacidiphilum kamchatkense Kam1]
MASMRFAANLRNYNTLEILLQFLHLHDNKKCKKNNLLNFLVLFSFERYPLQRLFLNKRR